MTASVFSRRELALFFGALALAAWAIFPSKYFQGRMLSREPEREAAVAYLKDYLERHPTHKGAIKALAEVYESVGDPDSAVTEMRQLYSHRRGDLSLGEQVVELLERAGRLEEARDFRWRVFEDAQGRADADLGRLENLVYHYYQLSLIAQDDPGILRALEGLSRVARNSQSYLSEIVEFHVSRGNLDAAAAALRTRMAERPQDLSLREDLIYVLRAKGRTQEALAEIEAGLKAKPRHVPFLAERASLREDAGLCEEAIGDFSRLAVLAPTEPWYRQAWAQNALKCRPLEEAAALHVRLLDKHPGDRVLWNNLIYLHADRDRHREAAETLERFLKAFPDDPEGVENLAYQYEKLGRSKDALELLAGYAKRNPQDRKLAREAGLALLQAGRLAEADPLLRPLLGRAPEDRELWWALIYAYADRKKLWPAGDLLEGYVERFPDDPKAYDELAQVFISLDRKDKAIKILERYFALRSSAPAASPGSSRAP